MAEFCECDELPIIPNQSNPRDSVEVVGVGEIVVTPSIGEGGKKVFTVERVPYTPPQILATTNPVREVGQLVDFTWEVNIQQGRNPIDSRQIVPSASVDLEAPFEVSVEDDTRATRGFKTAYTITVQDNIPTVVSKVLGVQYYNKVYRGFSWKDGITAGQELTEADILAMTGTLADNIKSVYGGVKNYVIPVSAVQQYIWWIYESGTTPIGDIELSNLPFPVVFISGTTAITNPHNGAISTNYLLVRSANKFGNGTLTLNMK